MSKVGTKKEAVDVEIKSRNLQLMLVELKTFPLVYSRVIPRYAVLQRYLVLVAVKETRSTPT